MGFETQRSVRAGPNPRIGALGFRPFGLTSVLAEGRSFSVHEQVTGHLPFAQMRRFTRSGPAAQAGRVLVVAPLAGAFPYLMRDLVAGLLGLVADVTVTDWPDARHVPVSCGPFGFDENVLETAVLMQALAGEGPLHVVGICQGVMPALCATLLLAQNNQEGHVPASLSLLGGPVDAGRNPTRLDRMLAGPPEALEGLLEVVPPVFAGGGRRVFPRRRQMQAFALYLWRQGLSGAGLPLRMLLDEGSDPLRFPLARLCWDMMDIPAEFFLGNVEQVFRRRALATGGMAIAGQALDPVVLSQTGLLTVEGERDDISAPGQTAAAHDLCTGLQEALRARLVIAGADHFALFYGQTMRTQVLPAIAGIMSRS